MLSALYFLISSVVHVVVEILFCLLLPKDHILFYVALSFEIGLLSGFVLLPFYLRSRSRLLKFGFSRFSFVPVFSVLKASLSFLLFFGLQFAMNFILIKVATSAFRSEAEMNTYAITSNLVFVLDLFVTSLIQMIPATVSSLYGEKDYSGVRFIVKKVLLLSLVSSSILWIATLSYPKLFLYIFGMGATAVSSDYDLVIRFYSIAILLYMANRFIQTYYPCISSNLPSLINTILEKGALGIPLGVSLMLSYSVLGYSLGSTLSEALALMITAVFLLFYRKKKQASSLLLPKGDPNRPRYEWTVSSVNEVEEASAFVKEKVLEAGGRKGQLRIWLWERKSFYSMISSMAIPRTGKTGASTLPFRRKEVPSSSPLKTTESLSILSPTGKKRALKPSSMACPCSRKWLRDWIMPVSST